MSQTDDLRARLLAAEASATRPRLRPIDGDTLRRLAARRRITHVLTVGAALLVAIAIGHSVRTWATSTPPREPGVAASPALGATLANLQRRLDAAEQRCRELCMPRSAAERRAERVQREARLARAKLHADHRAALERTAALRLAQVERHGDPAARQQVLTTFAGTYVVAHATTAGTEPLPNHSNR